MTCRLSLYDSVTPRSLIDPTAPRSISIVRSHVSTAQHSTARRAEEQKGGREREELTETGFGFPFVVRRTKFSDEIRRIIPSIIRQNRRNLPRTSSAHREERERERKDD